MIWWPLIDQQITMASDPGRKFEFVFIFLLIVDFNLVGLFSISQIRDSQREVLNMFVYVFQSPASGTSAFSPSPLPCRHIRDPLNA